MSLLPPADSPEMTARLRDDATARQAFGEVIRLYSEPLYWHIRRMVQNHDDTDDLLQNTFMKAWSALDGFRGEAKLSTWLYKIATNEAVTFLARERRRLNVSLDDESAHLISSIEADADIDGDRLAQKLRKAVATLPEKQRLVFNMRYYDDMKYEAMSDILGTTVSALKTSYHLAVKKIEKFFADD